MIEETITELEVNNPYIYEIQVRFNDTDGLGHLNNAIYVTYMELARTYWHYENIGLESAQSFNWILGSVSVRFIQEGQLTDKIRVYMWVSRIGSKSWDFSYAIVAGDQIIAKATSTQIGFNYQEKKSVEISLLILEDLKNRCGKPWKDFNCVD